LDRIEDFSDNYKEAGGAGSLSEYFTISNQVCAVRDELKKNITFANHNLVSDRVFGEMHLILCRNVLIYFDTLLRENVLALFRESLVFDGFFCLGSKESLKFSKIKHDMKVIDESAKIYQKKSPDLIH